jgi:hypothetical protein
VSSVDPRLRGVFVARPALLAGAAVLAFIPTAVVDIHPASTRTVSASVRLADDDDQLQQQRAVQDPQDYDDQVTQAEQQATDDLDDTDIPTYNNNTG